MLMHSIKERTAEWHAKFGRFSYRKASMGLTPFSFDTLEIKFGDPMHMQFNPPIVSKKITIHVK